MAKRYIIYANGKDLATVPVTQNEGGKYYWNGSVYFKPVLGEFDTATPPAGFKAYLGGSHTVYLGNAQRNPIDFSLVAGTVITMNVDVQVLASTLADGSWCKVQIVGTNIILAFVHTYKWASGIVKAGNAICIVAPQSVTGFAPHLHNDDWSGLGRRVRDLILYGEYMEIQKGDVVKITGGDMNLRGGAGTGFTNNVRIIKEGAVVRVKDNPRSSQNSLFYGKGSTIKENDTYTWIDIQDLDAQTGWIAVTSRVVKVGASTPLTRIDGTTVTPTPPAPEPEPVDPCKSVKDSLKACETNYKNLSEKSLELEKRCDKAESDNELYKVQIVDLKKEVKRLEGETEELNNEKIKLQEDFDRIKKERDTFEEEKLELQKQLSKGSLAEASTGEIFAELWGRIIRSIK